MILFEKDWNDYPNAIVDLKTTNQSFIDLAGVFKKMGNKNHSFILALHNPLLQGIDPYDPNLTEEQLVMIGEECFENFWYFIREIARAPARAGGEGIQFKANIGNISLFWLFWNHITTYLVQPRQTGKSFSTDIIMRYLLNIKTENTQIFLLTKDDQLRGSNIERLKDIELELPAYLKMTTRADLNNTEAISVKALGNSYVTRVMQSSIKAAMNIGRGLTLPIVHVDELAYITNLQHTLPALLSATGAAAEIAKENNEPFGTIFTTTAGKPDTKDGKYAYELLNNGFKFTSKIFDCENEEAARDMVIKNSKDGLGIAVLVFNHRQLGFTDAWLKERMRLAIAKGSDAERDFLNRWMSGTETSPIPKELLEILNKSRLDNHFAEIGTHGYITRWYIPEHMIASYKNRSLIMGLDTSDAVGKDDIAMVIRDVKTGAVVAIGEYNETNTISFSSWLFSWIEKFPKLTMLIERKSSGVAMIDHLLELCLRKEIDPFKRLFNWVVSEHLTKPDRLKAVMDIPLKKRTSSLYDKYRGEFGYATSGSGRASRDNLYRNGLLAALKFTGMTVRDPMLVSQLSSIAIRNNRLDHSSSGKDDLIIGWLLGWWFLKEAQGKEYYGIGSNEALSRVMDNVVISTADKAKMKLIEEQQLLKDVIDKLIAKLRQTINPGISFKIKAKLQMLSRLIDSEVLPDLNLKDLIDKIELEKMKKNISGNYAQVNLLAA